MPIVRALEEAGRRGLDLVLQTPLADPPLCEIMDMSRYIYNDQIAIQATKAPPLTPEPMLMLPIPEDAKSFLADPGLPERFLEFCLDYDRTGLIRLDRYVEWWREIERVAFSSTCLRLGRKPTMWRSFVLPHSVDLSRHYLLGEMDLGITLCIERDSARIYQIDIAGHEGYSAPAFVNSHVIKFGQFIVIFNSATDDDRTTIRSRLSALDPNAMEDRDRGFWSTLIEEFEAGI
jgi:hypothetical protein